MGDTEIQWADKVWNPVTGCTKVSSGCKNCYAERLFPRTAAGQRVPVNASAGINDRDPDPADDSHFRQRVFTDVMCHDDRLEQPLHWRKPLRIFVNSMSDLFHEDVPFAFIDKVFATMARCPQHTFQILTKRPTRMRDYLRTCRNLTDVIAVGAVIEKGQNTWPLPNVWLGVSVEDQKTANERIPLLLRTIAHVRFVSYEPALSMVNFRRIEINPEGMGGTIYLDVLAGKGCSVGGNWDYVGIDWLIIGGESGPSARPFHFNWARTVIKQAIESNVPVFMKQIGSRFFIDESVDALLARFPPAGDWKIDASAGGSLPFIPCDRKGGDMSEWEEDLRVRQFPKQP